MIKEVIVVEGRDDEQAVGRAVEASTIATHGFGIAKKTWELIEKAYQERGIIVFTDPDFAGEQIRKRITEKFPEAKQAYLTQEEAWKAGDIGIENERTSGMPSARREPLPQRKRIRSPIAICLNWVWLAANNPPSCEIRSDGNWGSVTETPSCFCAD